MSQVGFMPILAHQWAAGDPSTHMPTHGQPGYSQWSVSLPAKPVVESKALLYQGQSPDQQ